MVVFPDFWVLSYRRPTEGALTTNLLSCSLSGASRSCYWPLHVRQSNLGVGCAFLRRTAMDDTQVGWIAAIIIGGVAGWLAEQFMKSEMGLVMNIVLGIVGAAVASAILSFFGVHLGGWIGYLIAGFIGAVLLIWVWRAIGARRQFESCTSCTATDDAADPA